MKKAIILFTLIAFFSIAYSATSPVPISSAKSRIKATEVYLPVGNTGQLISLMDLSRISVKNFESLSGKKMKFVDKVKFKIGQRQLKKSINNDGTFSKKRVEKFFTKASIFGVGFNIGGFALGLFLNLVGVLIAYLLRRGDKKSMVTWAWIGCIISLIVWGAVLI